MKSLWRSPFLTFVLIVIDAAILSWLWMGCYGLRQSLNPMFENVINPVENYRAAIPWLLPIWLLVLARFRFYAHHERIASLNRLGPILWSVFWIFIFISLYNLKFKPDFGRSVVLFFGASVFLYLFLSRTVFRMLKRGAIARGQGRVRVLVVGSGELGRQTLLQLRDHPDIGFRVMGYVRAGEPEEGAGEMEGDVPVLGRIEELSPLIQRHRVEEVFFATTELGESDIFRWIDALQSENRVICKVVANMLYVIVNQAKVDEILGLPVLAFRGRRMFPLERGAKRLIDIAACLLALPFVLPAWLLFAVLIKMDSPGPVLFRHQRVGLKGRGFTMLKFRTMRTDADPYAEAPVDEADDRVTRFGGFLRRSSLDELPQVWNVLRGDMSLVGPRPEMPFIVERYTPWQRRRLEVQPGLTGLWQVAGRKNLPLHYNIEYDYYYVKNQGLAMDLSILMKTLPAVLAGKGAY